MYRRQKMRIKERRSPAGLRRSCFLMQLGCHACDELPLQAFGMVSR